MHLNKITNKIQSEEYCNKIIQQNNLIKQSFYDLSYIQRRTNSTTNLWYAYNKQCKINFIDLINYSETYNFVTLESIKSKIKNKYEYWKNYMQQITSIEINLIIEEIMQLELLGSFFSQSNIQHLYVCAIKSKENYSFQIFNEDQFLNYLYSNKLQTIKEKQLNLLLNTEQINQFINK